MTAGATLVGMGEVQVGGSAAEFGCLGIGSGIVLAAFEPVARVGGCAHFFLPVAPKDFDRARPGKYVDTGIEELLTRMLRLGADEKLINVALVGGATVITSERSSSARIDLGLRNAESAHRALAAYGMRCLMEELGGQTGRSLAFSGKSGEVRIGTCLQPEKLLCRLQG